MREHRRASLLGLIVGGCLVATLPFMVGQGCATTTSVPGNGIVDSIPGGLPGDGSNGNNGNGGGPAGVTFRFTAPTGDVQAEVGDRITVVWTDSAPAGSTAVIALLLVPAPGSNNGNTVPVALNIPINDPANYYIIDTGLLNLSPGSYRITARISDGTSETTATVPGWLNLGEYGSRIKPLPPTVVVTEPQQNLSTSQGSGFDVNYCQHNRSGGEAPQVLIMLDNNRDPLDDIFADISGDNVAIADRISKICSSPMPVVVDGGVVVGCQKGVDCTNPAAGTPFTISADVMSRIPKQPNGEPYNVRVSVWDHINPPVHAYAAGTISVTSMATGTVPLEKVGKTLAGAKFMGGDTGGWLGSTGTMLPGWDINSPKTDNFILVARFGRPRDGRNVGSAYLVYGRPGKRYGGDIEMGGFGTQYRGCQFWMDPYSYSYSSSSSTIYNDTDGITSVSWIADRNGDGIPEIMFASTQIQTLYDDIDDDPCDKDGLCYNFMSQDPLTGASYPSYSDGLPNPRSTAKNDDPLDDMTGLDHRSDATCYTPGANLTSMYVQNPDDPTGPPVLVGYPDSMPINQGYIFYVSSANPLENSVLCITDAGQKLSRYTSLRSGIAGARIRGNHWWWAGYSTGIRAETGMGTTVSTMPQMSKTDYGVVHSSDWNFLFSAPLLDQKQGAVVFTYGQDLATFTVSGQPTKSIPDIAKFGDCFRETWYPYSAYLFGAKPGDEFGYAGHAGDFNGDGNQDILCGAPGSSYGGASQAGTVYVIYGRPDFSTVQLANATDPKDPTYQYVPRMEIRGENKGDRFGENQQYLGKFTGNENGDIAIASKYYGGPGIAGSSGASSGYVGIICGNRWMTGESSFTVTQIGTPQLPGVVFYGTQAGGMAGATIANAGDFNGDGFNDLLICAPGETRVINNQVRKGVAYLIFGGTHLMNKKFSLSQVGNPELPGIVFVSPYVKGQADEATIDFVGAAGDVDGDGFADLIIGVSQADYVNPLDPSQRRRNAGETYLIYGSNAGGNRVSY